MNTRTRVLHVESESGNMICGKRTPMYVEFFKGWPTVDFHKCVKCFSKDEANPTTT